MAVKTYAVLVRFKNGSERTMWRNLKNLRDAKALYNKYKEDEDAVVIQIVYSTDIRPFTNERNIYNYCSSVRV